MKTLDNIVRENMIKIRKARGHSQAQLARICGKMSQQNISNVERGVIYPSLAHISAYASVYNVSPAWFLEE